MAIFKHSLVISGRKTSVSMEPEFWEAFSSSAKARGLTLSEFGALIDADRDDKTNLSSAIRLQVLRDVRKAPAPMQIAAE